jgi:hypothetical protein
VTPTTEAGKRLLPRINGVIDAGALATIALGPHIEYLSTRIEKVGFEAIQADLTVRLGEWFEMAEAEAAAAALQAARERIGKVPTVDPTGPDGGWIITVAEYRAAVIAALEDPEALREQADYDEANARLNYERTWDE